MIKAIIFDMDGLLIDSEPYWKKAEQEVFPKVGIDLTEEMCAETTGYDILNVIKYWHKKFPWDETKVSFESLRLDILELMKKYLAQDCEEKPGVQYIFDYFKSKGMKMAVASSSPMDLIDIVVDRMGLRNDLHSMYSSQSEPYGKPYPGVYISAAKGLGVNPLECLAFEDSFYGLLAAKSARMKAVGVLEPQDFKSSRFNFADYKLLRLTEFTDKLFEELSN